METKKDVIAEAAAELNANIESKASAFADNLLNKLAEIAGQDLKKTASDQTENVAVSAEEEGKIASEAQENKMEEIQKTEEAAATPETHVEADVQADAAVATEAAHAPEEAKEDKADKPADDKPADKPADAPKADKEEKPGEKKDGQLKPEQMDAVKALLEAVKGCGECQSDPKVQEAVAKAESAFPAAKKEEAKPAEMPAAPEMAPAAPALPEAPAPIAEAQAPLATEECYAPYANLVATLDKKASVGDSRWTIKDSTNDREFASFRIEAAFGKHINEDEDRAAYATSEEFGKAVVASLAANKAHDLTSTQAAVFQVVAHYSPKWAGAEKFKDIKPSTHAKAQGAGDVTTDKNLISEGKEAKAAVEENLAKKAEYNVPGVTDNGEIPADSLLLDGADKRSEKVNNGLEESAHAKNSTKVETETDRKIMASYEAQIKRQASENEALLKQIETLKTEAAIKEKSAKVKECVALMCTKGFIKADEAVRVASLKEGLSLEAANGRAMASSIDKQAKYLFGMNSTQLDAYMNSLKGVSTPVMTTNASANQALTIKASATAENETDRLLKLFGWD